MSLFPGDPGRKGDTPPQALPLTLQDLDRVFTVPAPSKHSSSEGSAWDKTDCSLCLCLSLLKGTPDCNSQL